jgi:hypothetical protein
MTLYRLGIAVALVAATTAFVGVDAVAMQINPGIYSAYSQITAVVASGGATCPAVGDTGSPPGTFYYPGPSASGAVSYQATFVAGLNQYYIVIATYPKTAAAGVNTWKGTGHISIPGLGYNSSFTFSTTATVTSPDAYTGVGTVIVTGNNGKGTCTETTAAYSIRQGK